MITLSLALIPSLLSAAPLPQEASAGSRRTEARIAGRVLDRNGDPVANATVTLLRRPLPTRVEPELEHRVVATTDARGMFRAALRPRGGYSLWARWPGASTAILEGVGGTPGKTLFVELNQDRVCEDWEMELVGLADWERELGPITCRAVVGTENLDFVNIAVEDGKAQMPALPRMHPVLEFLNSDGRVVWAITGRQRGRYELPALRRVQIRVLDRDGQPVQGAKILRHIRNYWSTQSPVVPPGSRFQPLWPAIGRTDGEGRLSTLVPVQGSPEKGSVWLLATREGLRPDLAGWQDGKVILDGKVKKEKGEEPMSEEVVATLEPQSSADESLAVGGRPVDGRVHIQVRVWAHEADGGGTGTPMFLPPIEVKGGRYGWPVLPPRWEVEDLWVTMSEDHGAALEEALGVRVAPSIRLASASADPLDPATHRVLRVIDADGRPAARSLVVTALPAFGNRTNTEMTRADHLGRALVGRHLASSITAVTETGWGVILQPDEGDLAPLQLRLRPELQASVIDQEGNPVSGAVMMATVPDAREPTADEHLAPEAAANLLYSRLPRPVTNAEGHLTFRMIPVAGDVQLRIQGQGGGWQHSEAHSVDGTETAPPPVQLEVQRLK